MAKFRVEVWHVQSYQMEVDAGTETQAEAEAERILQEMSPTAYGAERDDQWLDVMHAEAA